MTPPAPESEMRHAAPVAASGGVVRDGSSSLLRFSLDSDDLSDVDDLAPVAAAGGDSSKSQCQHASSQLPTFQRESTTAFLARLHVLPIKRTLGIEIAESFSWRLWIGNKLPPPDLATTGDQAPFVDCTIQRTKDLEWRVASSEPEFRLALANRMTLDARHSDPIAPITKLFVDGWFRPYTVWPPVSYNRIYPERNRIPNPHCNPRALRVAVQGEKPKRERHPEGDATTLALVGPPAEKKQKLPPRKAAAIKEDWEARALNPDYKMVRLLGEQDGRADELSFDEVKCIPCHDMIQLQPPANLHHFDSHAKSHAHQELAGRWERWTVILKEASPHLLVLEGHQIDTEYGLARFYCVICQRSIPRNSSTTWWEIEPVIKHVKSPYHAESCGKASVDPIPRCIIAWDQAKNAAATALLTGVKVMKAQVASGSWARASEALAFAPAASQPLSNARVSTVGASPLVATAPVAMDTSAFVAAPGCNGVAHGDEYAAMADIRTEIKVMARPPRGRKVERVKGKEKVTEAHNGIPAVEHSYRCHYEDGTVVVRSKDCHGDQATKNPCNECLSVSRSNLNTNALNAKLTEAKLQCYEAMICSSPAPEQAMRVLAAHKVQVAVPGKGGKQCSTAAEEMQRLIEKPMSEQRTRLTETMSGWKGQGACFQPSFQLRLELLKERMEKFDLIAQTEEVGTLSPTMQLAVAKMSNDGLHGKEMEAIMAMYVSGDLETRSKALLGLIVGAAEKSRRDNLGISMSGAKLKPSVFNFFLSISAHGSKVLKTVSVNLLGYELDVGNLRRKVPQILNLPKGTMLELIEPSDEDLNRTVELLLASFRLGPSKKLINVHVDPTKVAGALQYCAKRGVIFGGDGRNARIPVPNQGRATDMADTVKGIPPADQANIFAISPQIAGYPAFEVAAWPERHNRKNLTPDEAASLAPATTAESVFVQCNGVLNILQRNGASIASFGCDGGVHGMKVIESLHRTDGDKLDIVASRTEEPMDGMLLGKFGVKLIICKTTQRKVIAGTLDPPHILKRIQEALVSGTHLLIMGPQHYFSWGFAAQCGVCAEIVRKPDAMSDRLTQAAFSPEVMQQILDGCPPALDPTGTILMLFIVGEAIDTTLHQGLLDIERVARLVVAETVITGLRKYVHDSEKGRVSDFAMHGTPAGNWIKFCNSFIGQALEWANDYPDEPNFPPGHGSIRLETRFSVRRAKTENFGLLDLSNQQLNDLAVATLIANGDVRAPSSNKGYTSYEEREMHPTAYQCTPKFVLQMVMRTADQVKQTQTQRPQTTPTDCSL